MIRVTLAAGLALLFTPSAPAQDTPPPARPNILWIYVEDMNPWLSCYGDALIETPNIDRLADRGVRFDRAYMPSAVCSATRSAVITGAMQTSLGMHNHRSSRAEFRGQRMGPGYDAVELPPGVRTLPEMLRAAGYYTFNQGKTDYNFAHDPAALYHRQNGQMNLSKVNLRSLWRAAGERPFFGQIQLRGGKNRPANKTVDRADVEVPPYYPDIPLVREEIAHHYECVLTTDAEVGAILDALDADRLTSRTVVFFFSDHGFKMHRHKQFLYEGGIRVPLVIAGPAVPRGAVRDDLVSGVDLAQTVLGMAGLDAGRHMEGRDVFAAGSAPRPWVIAARDRCDYTIDRIRAVVTPRYKYLRNYLTDRPYMQPQYRDPWPVTVKLRELAAAGGLTPTQMQFYGEDRPAEELYNLDADPDEVHNLAGDPRHQAMLLRHRNILAGWIKDTGDLGQQAESDAGIRAVLRRWKGKCVNPEYAEVRAAMQREERAKARVLILGDSISMGYGPHVIDALFDEAVVKRPPENCQGTTHGVKKVDEWLRLNGGGWDVIWFNFGLHDLKRVNAATGKNSNDPRDPHQANPETYERQLRTIVARLKRTGAALIFATTTPVPEGQVRPHRDAQDPPLYNEIARRVMADNGVAVHDLHGFALARLDELQRPANVHFTPAGSRALAAEVAARVRAALPKR